MSRTITFIRYGFYTLTQFSGTSLFFLALIGVFLSSPAGSSIADGKVFPKGSVSTKTMSKSDIERARNYFTDTELTTHEGNKVRFYSDVLDERIVMINVIYTNCKGSCPLLTQKLSQVSRELGELYGKSIHFVSITNDAERDTPEALS